MVSMPLTVARTKADEPSGQLDVVRVHEEHADFVWLTLQRLGVRGADAEDLLQEVFVVVHRKLSTFDGSSKMRTWLFGISMRVAADYRKRAHRRYERPLFDAEEEPVASGASPEEQALRAQERRRLRAILDTMDLEARSLFVMFEIDEVPCDEIAEMLGVPVGTVYSRLHAARKAFHAAVARDRARDRGVKS
jgi:RNA polymerase sigma-70 factor (ECF subfamily)